MRAAGELILYEDSYGAYAIAINGGNARALTEAAPATRSECSAIAGVSSEPERPGRADGERVVCKCSAPRLGARLFPFTLESEAVARAGLEPATPRFSAVCSTN